VAASSDLPSVGESIEYGYLTNTRRGTDAIPLATTSMKLRPGSSVDGTSKWVDTSLSEATAMLLWS
jgi:hypothetical protein